MKSVEFDRDPLMKRLDGIVKLNSEEPGKYLYHYSKRSTVFESILPSNNIRFSPLAKTNDPEETVRFESINLDATKFPATDNSFDLLMNAKTSFPNRFLSASFTMDKPYASKNDTENYSEIQNHVERGYLFPRMWALYGENHEGVCLCFDREKLEREFSRIISETDDIISSPVKYLSGVTNKFYSTSFFSGNSPLMIPANIDSVDTVIQHVHKNAEFFFFTKQDDWKDECEFRFIYSVKGELKNYFDINFGGALEAIILGHRFPTEEYEKVKNACSKYNVDCYRVLILPGFSTLRPAMI